MEYVLMTDPVAACLDESIRGLCRPLTTTSKASAKPRRTTSTLPCRGATRAAERSFFGRVGMTAKFELSSAVPAAFQGTRRGFPQPGARRRGDPCLAVNTVARCCYRHWRALDHSRYGFDENRSRGSEIQPHMARSAGSEDMTELSATRAWSRNQRAGPDRSATTARPSATSAPSCQTELSAIEPCEVSALRPLIFHIGQVLGDQLAEQRSVLVQACSSMSSQSPPVRNASAWAMTPRWLGP